MIERRGNHRKKTNGSTINADWMAAIIESAEDAIVSKTLKGIITSWNKGAERIFGYTSEEIIGKSITTLFSPERLDEEARIIELIKSDIRVEHFETVRLHKDGTPIEVSLSISPIKDLKGKIVGASKIARDIRERKATEKRLVEQTEIVNTVNSLGALLSAELEHQKLVQAVTDAATDLTGAQFGAFFYNVLRDDGEAYLLYTLSGVPREAFAHFPNPRATDLFGPTFRGEATILSDDIRLDPRYGKSGPHYGMPEGHLPVVSYLAVPVVSRSGEVIGGLFFGHSDSGMFTERHGQIVQGLAAQAAIAMDNARLYEKSQQELRERKALLQSEQDARRQAEIANRTKDEFLGLLSHELRTPLNAILGWSRMLSSRKVDDETFNRAIETIERNAKLQSRLIDDMLDVSRIISGKLRLDAQPVDLTVIINAAVETVRPAADAKTIRISVVLDYGAGMVLGDSTRLQQITWNLLSNAVKFTPRDGSVKVSLERINSHVEIIVADSGIGIDEGFLPYVFDRFRQGDPSASKKYGGLGLGLSIVRQLVELHGGTVEAANRPEQTGAIFTVKLPVMAVRTEQQRMHESSDRGTSNSINPFSVESMPSLAGLKILAVDDEPDARFLLNAVLEQCGADVQTAASTAEALDLIVEYRPDVLVSDIGMPGEDGYELIRKVREQEKGTGKRIPAVALTAFARVEDRLKALSAGFNMHVPKPVEPTELTVVIANLVK